VCHWIHVSKLFFFSFFFLSFFSFFFFFFRAELRSRLRVLPPILFQTLHYYKGATPPDLRIWASLNSTDGSASGTRCWISKSTRPVCRTLIIWYVFYSSFLLSLMMFLIYSTKPARRRSSIFAREICDRTTGKMRCNFCSFKRQQRGKTMEMRTTTVFVIIHRSFIAFLFLWPLFPLFERETDVLSSSLILVTFN